MKRMIIVYTGNGKGKTTAAVGLAARAAGNNLRVLCLQFIKSKSTGESQAMNQLGIDCRQLGLGLVTKSNLQPHCTAAINAVQIATAEILSNRWDLIVLDEINTAYSLHLIALSDLLSLIGLNPAVHLVFTGRNAPEELINAADIVTEMRLIKHSYLNGQPAQVGIEF